MQTLGSRVSQGFQWIAEMGILKIKSPKFSTLAANKKNKNLKTTIQMEQDSMASLDPELDAMEGQSHCVAVVRPQFPPL